ncbi:MAG: hypothetical protein L0Z50_26365 [Verrucomicrobiales bacterium]|nr:hypothetical protein [Verrucomicrobiales bacterium]
MDENGFLGEPRTNSFVELSSGMHVFSEADRKWVDASDEVEILEEGAVARQSQHHVSFAGNLNDPNGTIDLKLLDGKRLRCRVTGLAYSEDGKSAFIAETKDCQGFVFGRNQVLYIQAFDSGISADIRYTTTLSSFEQDVIIREQLPSPLEYGMNPDRTNIEIWTHFLDPPPARKIEFDASPASATNQTDVLVQKSGADNLQQRQECRTQPTFTRRLALRVNT